MQQYPLESIKVTNNKATNKFTEICQYLLMLQRDGDDWTTGRPLISSNQYTQQLCQLYSSIVWSNIYLYFYVKIESSQDLNRIVYPSFCDEVTLNISQKFIVQSDSNSFFSFFIIEFYLSFINMNSYEKSVRSDKIIFTKIVKDLIAKLKKSSKPI